MNQGVEYSTRQMSIQHGGDFAYSRPLYRCVDCDGPAYGRRICQDCWTEERAAQWMMEFGEQRRRQLWIDSPGLLLLEDEEQEEEDENLLVY